MAKHKIRIEYLENQGSIDNLEFDVEPNNLSSKALNDLTNANAYESPFLLNLSDLSGKNKYLRSAGVKYYISSVLSDANSNIDISISVTTTNATSLTLVFSDAYFPTSLVVNGIVYENTNSTFQLGITSTSTTTTKIQILKMNLPNVPLILTNINTGITIDYNDDYIININRGSQLSTDNEKPNYELVYQYGSCEFIDEDNVVLNLKASGVLKKPKKIEIYLDDNIIGTYKIDTWRYNTQNSVVSITLTNEEKSLEIYPIEAQKPIAKNNNYYAYDLFLEIKEKLSDIGIVVEELDSNIQNWLSSILINVLKYNSTTLKDLIYQFCCFTQTSFFINEKGNLEVYLWR